MASGFFLKFESEFGGEGGGGRKQTNPTIWKVKQDMFKIQTVKTDF